MTTRELFAISANGLRVLYDPIGSHAATHFADTPQIMDPVKKVLENTIITGEIMEFDFDTGHKLGMSDLVETDSTDEIVYAIRKNRDRYMRFTKSRESLPSSKVTISLTMREDGQYELFSAWLGPLSPATPNSPFANSESRSFWSSHALVWGNQEIITGTETTTCPW